MGLEEIVTISVTSNTKGVAQTGFGVMMILSGEVTFADRIRYYGSIDDVAADAAVTTGTYKCAAAIFSQDPKPTLLAIGRLVNKPTQKWTLVPTVANSTVYSITMSGQTVSYTSDGSATAAEIVDALVTALNALAAPALIHTAANVANTLVITADAPGNWDSIEVVGPGVMSLAQDHADPGVEADLDAIKLVDDGWYGVANLYNSSAMVEAAVDWAQAQTKMFFATLSDSLIATATATGSADIADTLNAEADQRVFGFYHEVNGSFAGEALGAQVLSMDPGSWTAKFKTIVGVKASKLTPTNKVNLRAKNCNFYESVGGVSISTEGVTFGGEFADVVQGLDWLKARMAEAVFGQFVNTTKTPFDDGGIAVVGSEILGVLKKAVGKKGSPGLLSSNPAPVVNVPLAADVASADKKKRKLTGVEFFATLAGAIHSAAVKGTVSA